MTGISSIIKDIEQYFLSISQKGIMLSSKDYHLIMGWIDHGYTKEEIMQGIRNTFLNKDKSKIRNLSDCADYIESLVKANKNPSTDTGVAGTESADYIVHILNNFKILTKKQNKTGVLEFINEYSEKLKIFINDNEKDLFSNINRLEEQFFLNFPSALDKYDSEIFESKKNEFITNGKDYINEKAKNKALNNYTKNLIIDTYIGINPFEL